MDLILKKDHYELLNYITWMQADPQFPSLVESEPTLLHIVAEHTDGNYDEKLIHTTLIRMRKHAKQLLDAGMITRQRSTSEGRPYVYRMTSSGDQALKSAPLSVMPATLTFTVTLDADHLTGRNLAKIQKQLQQKLNHEALLVSN